MVNLVGGGECRRSGIPHHRSMREVRTAVGEVGPQVDEGPERHYHRRSIDVVAPVGTRRTIRLARFDCFEPQRVSISTSGNVLMVTDRPCVHTECGWSVADVREVETQS